MLWYNHGLQKKEKKRNKNNMRKNEEKNYYKHLNSRISRRLSQKIQSFKDCMVLNVVNTVCKNWNCAVIKLSEYLT